MLAGYVGDEEEGDDGPEPPENGTEGEESEDGEQWDEAAIDELVRANRTFALKLYDELVSDSPGENLFYSPHSISVALAMLYAGACGDTEARIEETMRYTLGEDVHPAIDALADELEARSDVADVEGDPFELAVANAVWGQAGYPFREAYLEVLERHYDAGLREADFRSNPEAARRTINEWVAERTDGTIEELLPEGSITDLVRLVVTNAVYFRAGWTKPFDEEATDDAQFTGLDGSTAAVPMMRQSASFPYASVDGHQLLELPYVGETVGMVIVLPAGGEFETFEENLDADRLEELVAELAERDGDVAVPRFEFDSAFSLKDALSAMGMATAFEDDANFSGIVDPEAVEEDLALHDVYHDAYVSVDEEGTEAAAATGGVAGIVSEPEDPFQMTVDRPFVVAIRDRPTGAVLFLGRVVDAEPIQR